VCRWLTLHGRRAMSMKTSSDCFCCHVGELCNLFLDLCMVHISLQKIARLVKDDIRKNLSHSFWWTWKQTMIVDHVQELWEGVFCTPWFGFLPFRRLGATFATRILTCMSKYRMHLGSHLQHVLLALQFVATMKQHSWRKKISQHIIVYALFMLIKFTLN
jgi:hypothetical protein